MDRRHFYLAAGSLVIALGALGCSNETTAGTPCTTDTECPTGQYCAGGDAGCTSDCSGDTDCSGGATCDTSRGRCVGGDTDGGVRDGGPPRDGDIPDAPAQDAPMAACDVDPDVDGDGEDAIACGGTDCDDNDANVRFGAAEVCDSADPDSLTRDENCDSSDDGVQTSPALSMDTDGDGFASSACCNADGCGPDCNDDDSAIQPDAAELCDFVDNNCDGTVDEGVRETVYVDCDGDGWGETGAGVDGCHGYPLPAGMGCSTGGQYVRGRMLSSSGAIAFDCNGTDATINPMAADGCPMNDGVDNDCDGATDESGAEVVYPDCDHDLWPRGTGSITGCHGNPLPAATGCAAGATWLRAGATADCDDANGNVYPTNTETCNGVDENCAGGADEGLRSNLYYDADGDGYGAGELMNVCNGTPGYVTTPGDCAPSNNAINPGATDVCGDGIDNNCAGGVDEAGRASLYRDADGDGYGAGSLVSVCTGTAGYVGNGTDCDDGRGDRYRIQDHLRADSDEDGYCYPGAEFSACVGGVGPVYRGFLGFTVREAYTCRWPDDCADLNNVIPGGDDPAAPDDCSLWQIDGWHNGCGCPGTCNTDQDLTCPTGWRPTSQGGYDRCFAHVDTGGGNCTPSENWTGGQTRSCHLTQTCNFLEGTNCHPFIFCEPCGVSSCAY